MPSCSQGKEKAYIFLYGLILEQAQCDISQPICLLNIAYFDAKKAQKLAK
jgi:hypothetical protein